MNLSDEHVAILELAPFRDAMAVSGETFGGGE